MNQYGVALTSHSCTPPVPWVSTVATIPAAAPSIRLIVSRSSTFALSMPSLYLTTVAAQESWYLCQYTSWLQITMCKEAVYETMSCTAKWCGSNVEHPEYPVLLCLHFCHPVDFISLLSVCQILAALQLHGMRWVWVNIHITIHVHHVSVILRYKAIIKNYMHVW